MKLIVTVDVEEDQWGVAPPGGATVENVYRLPTLQTLFNEFKIVPTYLVTYPVVRDAHAAGLLRNMSERGECEIGTHCHPWNTPPYEEVLSPFNSMLCNLPPALQYEKVCRLHEAIERQFNLQPVMFRSGRWGFDMTVADHLMRLRYRLDSSMTPYTSWVRQFGPDFSQVSPRTVVLKEQPSPNARAADSLVELPVTIGYLHGNFHRCARLSHRLKSRRWQRSRIPGLLSRLHVLRKVWLSPEAETPANMLQLVRQMKRHGYRTLNLVFHSSALKGGCIPFVRTEDDVSEFLHKLRLFLTLAEEEGVTFMSQQGILTDGSQKSGARTGGRI